MPHARRKAQSKTSRISLEWALTALHNYSDGSISMQTATATTKKLLIANLPEHAAVSSVRDLFNEIGKVLSVSLLTDGFAFVEMTAEDADKALVQLNGYRWDGKTMMIDEAHPRSRSRY